MYTENIYFTYRKRENHKTYQNHSHTHTLKTPGYIIAIPPSKIDPAECKKVYALHVYGNKFPNLIVFVANINVTNCMICIRHISGMNDVRHLAPSCVFTYIHIHYIYHMYI